MKPASTKRVQFVEMERLVGRELRDQEPVTGARFEDDILRLHVGQQSEDDLAHIVGGRGVEEDPLNGDELADFAHRDEQSRLIDRSRLRHIGASRVIADVGRRRKQIASIQIALSKRSGNLESLVPDARAGRGSVALAFIGNRIVMA